eukprot:SAG31_NODE_1537_length_7982_cov_2.277813_7_plen_71_part_00
MLIIDQFPETLLYLKELEEIYGFKTKIYYPKGFSPASGPNDHWSSMEEGAEVQKKVALQVLKQSFVALTV